VRIRQQHRSLRHRLTITQGLTTERPLVDLAPFCTREGNAKMFELQDCGPEPPGTCSMRIGVIRRYHFYERLKVMARDQDAIEYMCREAPAAVLELETFWRSLLAYRMGPNLPAAVRWSDLALW